MESEDPDSGGCEGGGVDNLILAGNISAAGVPQIDLKAEPTSTETCKSVCLIYMPISNDLLWQRIQNLGFYSGENSLHDMEGRISPSYIKQLRLCL